MVFDIPVTIQSDRGSHFTGTVFREMCSAICIRQALSSPNHAQSNGQVERQCVVNTEHGTRPTPTLNPLLELTVTNRRDLPSTSKILSPVADHCPVITSVSLNVPTSRELVTSSKESKWIRDMRCFNHSLFTTLLLRYPPLERIQGDVRIDYVWTVWYNHVMALFDKCTVWRLITTGHKNKKPWYDAHLQKLKSRQNRLYRQFLKHPQDPVCHSAYKLARNSYRLELRKARENQHRRLADDLEDTRRGTYHWWK